MTIRFHLDECVRSAVAIALRRHGIDVTTAQETGLIQAEDEAHIEFALNAGRVIVTHDRDFLAHASTTPTAGIVFVEQGRRSVGELIAFLRLLHGAMTSDEVRGSIEYF